jgi:DNA-binding CsgD family transcriptional regulator
MAKRLQVSIKATNDYLTRAKEKLGLKNLIELRRAAFRWNDAASGVGGGVPF